jgi:hypothetical protein
MTIEQDIELLKKKYADKKGIPIAETIMRVVNYAEKRRAEFEREHKGCEPDNSECPKNSTQSAVKIL